ncbi:radial spoke head 10 homolog B-like isoform X2 [Maniola jurtina]|uniref:radial spoke head 10 homolog B-like isoform X2 n=1 Tax=Maniola jurtina TaxID=191418 RepID=UPI001E6893C3|nr:radial spoke head 10 homolog B-like isoform X2 [Maniola jurtina]
MYYIDSQRTLTRRDSSVIVPKAFIKDDYEAMSTTRGPSTARLASDSRTSLGHRPRGSVRKEIITILFESMLDSIVESWEVIEQRKTEEINIDIGKTPSDVTSTSKKKRPLAKPSKSKKSRSKIELNDSNTQSDLMQMCWWAGPDEKAIIRFRNGNMYEGQISMKCMHGEGRYQWADGTIFLGQFVENEINGKGTIQWKDDTWYEGDFAGNLRHGKGLYVNSREQRSYTGSWHYGTKHGEGVICFSGSSKNSYDGHWIYNVRHGFGSREYCQMSGYKGEWNHNIREGKGLMIWPNHDFYRGEWKNGVMSGYGFYIWDACYNNSMSLPSLIAYRGFWEKGARNGHGILNLGLGLGSHYKGEFKNNKKHGAGKLVTNNGLILQNKHLFSDDNVGVMTREQQEGEYAVDKYTQLQQEPFCFNLCDSSVDLTYHIEQVIKNIDKQQDIVIEIVNEFMEANNIHISHVAKYETQKDLGLIGLGDLIDFEVSSLNKALTCYETNLKKIYYQYATICNKEEIHFTPILIRLYFWQLYYDCNIHEKGLTLVEIDIAFHENPKWLSRSPHNPFEKIYFWQFQHGLITVASKLYAKRQLPGKKPDTMLASAFRVFMENDVLPGVGRKKGKLAEGYGAFVPLKGLYGLYCSLEEPCTIRSFLCAVRYPPHDIEQINPALVDQDCHNLGRNAYIFGDEITFINDEPISEENDGESLSFNPPLKLFNFSNLSIKTIINICHRIFPQICVADKIMDLNVEMTFFEFFEAFIACVEESIRVTDEDVRLQQKSARSFTADIPALPKSK